MYVLFVLLIFGVFGNLIYISFSQDPFGLNKTFLASQQNFLACNALVDSMQTKFQVSALSSMAFIREVNNILSRTLVKQQEKSFANLVNSSDFK